MAGRPKKYIDKDEFEKLCALQCTLLEICSWFDITDKTLDRFCRETYGKHFSEVFEQKRGAGKISLRRAQLKAAMAGNPTMLIWLGRNWLNQSEQSTVEININRTEDALSKSLRDMAKELESDED